MIGHSGYTYWAEVHNASKFPSGPNVKDSTSCLISIFKHIFEAIGCSFCIKTKAALQKLIKLDYC